MMTQQTEIRKEVIEFARERGALFAGSNDRWRDYEAAKAALWLKCDSDAEYEQAIKAYCNAAGI